MCTKIARCVRKVVQKSAEGTTKVEVSVKHLQLMQRSKREDFENDEVNGIGNELTSRKDVEDERYRNKKKSDVESMESNSDEYQTSLESDGEF